MPFNETYITNLFNNSILHAGLPKIIFNISQLADFEKKVGLECLASMPIYNYYQTLKACFFKYYFLEVSSEHVTWTQFSEWIHENSFLVNEFVFSPILREFIYHIAAAGGIDQADRAKSLSFGNQFCSLEVDQVQSLFYGPLGLYAVVKTIEQDAYVTKKKFPIPHEMRRLSGSLMHQFCLYDENGHYQVHSNTATEYQLACEAYLIELNNLPLNLRKAQDYILNAQPHAAFKEIASYVASTFKLRENPLVSLVPKRSKDSSISAHHRLPAISMPHKRYVVSPQTIVIELKNKFDSRYYYFIDRVFEKLFRMQLGPIEIASLYQISHWVELDYIIQILPQEILAEPKMLMKILKADLSVLHSSIQLLPRVLVTLEVIMTIVGKTHVDIHLHERILAISNYFFSWKTVVGNQSNFFLQHRLNRINITSFSVEIARLKDDCLKILNHSEPNALNYVYKIFRSVSFYNIEWFKFILRVPSEQLYDIYVILTKINFIDAGHQNEKDKFIDAILQLCSRPNDLSRLSEEMRDLNWGIISTNWVLERIRSTNTLQR